MVAGAASPMRPAILFRVVILACLTAALDAAERVAAPLRLVAEAAGAAIELKSFGALRFRGEGPDGAQAVPLDAPLRIEGDLAANGRLIQWDPICHLARAPLRDSVAGQPRPWVGDLRITGDFFAQQWKAKLPDQAVAVFAWVHRGRIVRTAAQKLPADPRGENFRLRQIFMLTEAEAEGFGIVLVWSKGQFIAPAPAFRDDAVAAVFHDMMLGRADTLAAGLAGGRKSPVGQKAGALLNHAANSGLGEAVSLLLRHGARPGEAATLFTLETAARRGRAAIVEQLLERQGNFKQPRWLEPLLASGHDEVARRLVAHMPTEERVLRAAVEQALAHGFADLARELLRRSSWDATDHRRNSELLLRQIKLGYVAAARLLLELKADPNQPVDGMTLLGEAAYQGEHELVDALLRAGAKPDTPDARGSTPLLHACMRGDLALARRLLEAGADAKYQRRDGITALHFAAVHATPELARLLLAAGADPGAGATRPNPLEFALLAQAPETAAAIFAAGGRVDLEWARHERVLAAAVRLDAHAIIAAALARGWRPETASPAPWPLETYATLAGAPRVSTLLATERGERRLPPGPALASVSELDAPLRPLHAPVLRDSRQGRAACSPATVQLRVIVDEQGLVHCPRVERSDDGRLSFAALETVSRWQLSPPTKGGHPVCAETVLTVAFAPYEQTLFDLSEVDSPPMLFTAIDGIFKFTLTRAPRLHFTVTAEGQPKQGQILTPLPPREQAAAWDAVTSWTYAPATREGRPVAATVEHTLAR